MIDPSDQLVDIFEVCVRDIWDQTVRDYSFRIATFDLRCFKLCQEMS